MVAVKLEAWISEYRPHHVGYTAANEKSSESQYEQAEDIFADRGGSWQPEVSPDEDYSETDTDNDEKEVSQGWFCMTEQRCFVVLGGSVPGISTHRHLPKRKFVTPRYGSAAYRATPPPMIAIMLSPGD